MKSRSSTRNHGSTIRRALGPIPSHLRSFHFRKYQALQQGNCWDIRKRQVWPDQIQVGWLLPTIGGCCIHIWIQSISYDCDIYWWNSYTHWNNKIIISYPCFTQAVVGSHCEVLWASNSGAYLGSHPTSYYGSGIDAPEKWSNNRSTAPWVQYGIKNFLTTHAKRKLRAFRTAYTFNKQDDGAEMFFHCKNGTPRQIRRMLRN